MSLLLMYVVVVLVVVAVDELALFAVEVAIDIVVVGVDLFYIPELFEMVWYDSRVHSDSFQLTSETSC